MTDESPIKTNTECVVLSGKNLPNHSESLAGRGKFVRVSGGHSGQPLPTLRTRQEAYRLAAHIVAAAVELPPEEDQPYSFEEILAELDPELPEDE